MTQAEMKFFETMPTMMKALVEQLTLLNEKQEAIIKKLNEINTNN